MNFTSSRASQKKRLDLGSARWSLTRVLTLVFTGLCIISLVYISVASEDYLKFYPSLGSITQEISSVVYQDDPASNRTSIVSHVVVDNPSEYSGFGLKFIDLRVYFISSANSSKTLFSINPLTGSQLIDKPILSHSQINGDVTLSILPDQAAQLAYFNGTNYPLIAHCDLTVRISTFLDPVTGYVLNVSNQTITVS